MSGCFTGVEDAALQRRADAEHRVVEGDEPRARLGHGALDLVAELGQLLGRAVAGAEAHHAHDVATEGLGPEVVAHEAVVGPGGGRQAVIQKFADDLGPALVREHAGDHVGAALQVQADVVDVEAQPSSRSSASARSFWSGRAGLLAARLLLDVEDDGDLQLAADEGRRTWPPGCAGRRASGRR